jgi:hypothetical protein
MDIDYENREQLFDKEKIIKMFVEDLHRFYTETDLSNLNELRSGVKQM